jgi:hypothetical protein
MEMKLEEVIDLKELEARSREEERKEERREERKKTGADAIAKIFGEQFAAKYKEALQKAQEIPKQKLEQMKPLLIELLKSSSDFKATFDRFDVILATTPTNVERFPAKKTSAGNWKVTVVWPGSQSLRGPFISVFVTEEKDAKLLSSTPDKAFILIGKLQSQTYMGDVSYNFRVAGIIELE